MIHRAKRRDTCEKAIIQALRDAGASVSQLDGTGLPDLLVGYRGRTFLLEAKDDHGKFKIGGKKSASGLRESQEKWWSTWKGAAPVVVTTPAEALSAIAANGMPGDAVFG